MAEYNASRPSSVGKENRKFLAKREKDGTFTYNYILNFCAHGFMVGKPRAKLKFETGQGCRCPEELAELGLPLPKGWKNI